MNTSEILAEAGRLRRAAELLTGIADKLEAAVSLPANDNQATDEPVDVSVVEDAFNTIIGTFGIQRAKELLDQYSTPKLSQLPEDKYNAFVAECRRIVEGGGA